MDNPDSGDARFDSGSFRDPASRVRWRGDQVERVLTAQGLSDWTALSESGLLEAEHKRLIPTESDIDDALLRHERIPIWTYPYEWSFGMLKAAALLQLELIESALDRGLTLKDATPYNIQFRGVEPVFVDIGSFRRYEQGEPWLAYGQFCRLFLYPLMVQAHAGIPFRPLLRGSLDGIDPEIAQAMLRGNRLKSGVLLDVVMQARAQRKTAGRDVRRELSEAGFRPEMIKANLARLHRIVSGLEWAPAESTWSGYSECAHVGTQREPKADFVRRTAAKKQRVTTWDLGANDGYFSRLVAPHSDWVLAADADELVIDRLFQSLWESETKNVLPIVFDLSDPSPGLGWRGRERKQLDGRGRPDLVLLLAVVHHLVVSGNLPLTEVIDWLRSLSSEVVFEWVPPTDPMARQLALNKRAGEIHVDYDETTLRQAFDDRFDVAAESALDGRILFHLVPR
ncbi:MAG TPA: methyltransferase [Acidimicrobiia bacterium]|nr:methyltransferase [Acidimicrobiia bacterium]